MQLQYGEAFNKAGVANMGRQGAPWCGLRSDGILVFMAHQSFFRRTEQGWVYEQPGAQRNELPPSVAASRRLLEQYFREGRQIVLLVGVFRDDAEPVDGQFVRQAEFAHATGDYYEAELLTQDAQTGAFTCRVLSKHQL